MALRAEVYRNLDNLPPEVRRILRVADPATGELEFVDGVQPNQHLAEELVSVRVSIGNVSMVSWLANEIRSRWDGKCEVLLSRFLYGGSHCGDLVQLDQISQLLQEIEALDSSQMDLPEDLLNFLGSVRQLAAAAQAEERPIVFT